MKKLIVPLFLTLIIVTGCSCSKKEKKSNIKEDIKVNTNEKVIEDKKVDGIDIKNTSLVVEKGISTLTADVINNTDNDYKLDEYVIVIKDSKEKIIIQIPGYIGEIIKSGETRKIKTSITTDLSDAYSIEYEIKK